jgi:hypothetical protein
VKAVLPITYFGPIQFYKKYLVYSKCVIDVFEYFVKQSYRNRCVIYGANGPHPLSIPILKPNGNKTLTKDIQIDYATNWQHNHQRAIESSYRSSPFYEYYSELFDFVFIENHNSLVELNIQIQKEIFDILELDSSLIELSSEYVEQADFSDYRSIISPKTSNTSDSKLKNHVYQQVFADKHGFRS